MITPSVELVPSQSELPAEALSILNENETIGLQFLADHPDLNILIHFSAHGEADDLGSEDCFEVPLSNSDIYVKEGAGYEKIDQILLDYIAQHTLPQQVMDEYLQDNTFAKRQYGAIHGAGIRALIADTSADHRLTNMEPNTDQLMGIIAKLYTANGIPGISGSGAEALIKQVNDQENAREWVILADFGNKLTTITTQDDAMSQKLEDGSLSIFMTYGSLHTGLFHKMRQIGLQPERTFPVKPYVYNTLASLFRKKMFEKD